MDDWHEVSTLTELEAFLRTVGNFHDGIIKELHWVNRDYVLSSLSMLPYKLSDARLLVQRQWKDPSAVEIYFESVWNIQLDTVDFLFTSGATTELSSRQLGPPKSLLVLTMEGSKFAFERMRWRDASDWMGAEPRFAPFVMPN